MLQDVCDILKESYRLNWITSRDGNVSVRYANKNTFYITPSGVRKQDLTPDSFCEIQLTDSGWVDITQNTHRKPSGEIPLHTILQKENLTDDFERIDDAKQEELLREWFVQGWRQ